MYSGKNKESLATTPSGNHSFSQTYETLSGTAFNKSLLQNNNNVKHSDDDTITSQDIQNLRSIGRKSINDFTSEDIQKFEKWARKFYKELGTKSPFFRAWFGDWKANDINPAIATPIAQKANLN